MADDDKPAASDHPSHDPLAGETSKAEASKIEASKFEPVKAPAPPPPLSPASEWTASDRRGPVEHADDSDVERFVPAHEFDAQGDLDRPVEPAQASEVQAPEIEAERSDLTPHEADQETAQAPEPVARPVEAARPERGRSLVPVAAGVVVGAIIGAGSAWFVYSQGSSASDEPQKIAALTSRVDALEKRPAAPAAGNPDVAKLQSGLTDLQGKVAALQKTSQAVPSGNAPAGQGSGAADGVLAAKIAALGAAVDALQGKGGAAAQGGQVQKTQSDLASLQSGVADARKQAAGAQSGLDAVQSGLDAVKDGQKQLDGKVAALAAAVAGAQKQAQGAQAGIADVQKSQAALEGKLGSPALAVVADSLVQQVAAGQPYARQVDALTAIGADPAKVAVLREGAAQGVPSAKTLAARWKPLIDPVVAAGNKAPANADFGQRLEHGLLGLVSVRRADGTTGDDLGSRANLIATDLAAGDVPGAYATWAALPADAKARSAEWGAQAKTSTEALAAARDLQRQAIEALGAKKS